jgi:hypothetical protein
MRLLAQGSSLSFQPQKTCTGDGIVGRSDRGVLAITERGKPWKPEIAIRGSKRAKSSSRRCWPVDGGTWPPRARCKARTALYQGGQRLALPHPRPMPQGRSRWRPRFCARGRRAPMAEFGRLADLAKVPLTKSDMTLCCFGRLSRRAHGSGQSKRRSPGSSAGPLQHTPGPHLLPGDARPCVGPGM